jgi:hypothetical protein
MPPLRVLQTLTAAAALFAILGACGLPPPGRATRVVVRPRPPRAEVTIRSLTGTWAAVWRTPDGLETLTLSVVQSGDALSGTLSVQGRSLASSPARPAQLDVAGQFALALGQSHERVVVLGRPDATGNRISASISGLSGHPVVVTFQRQ